MSEETCKMKNDTKGLGWKVSLSILGGVGWLVFLIIWLFFYANEYVWEQNVAIFLSSIFVLCGIVGIPWVIWAIRNHYMEEDPMWKTQGFRWRVWFSMMVMLAVFLFLMYWFWALAEPYDVYQNVAIFIVSLLIVGGILGAMWAPWGMKHDHEHHHHSHDHDAEKEDE